MHFKKAYINGFVKRASEYGFSSQEAVDILFKLAGAPRTNADIASGINSINANPNKTPGNMALIDFPAKNQSINRRPVYTPTNSEVKFPTGVALANIPLAGNIIGPVARFAEGDFTGGLINAASTAALPLPGGIVLSKGLEVLNDVRDIKKHTERRALSNNAFEQGNRIVQD